MVDIHGVDKSLTVGGVTIERGIQVLYRLQLIVLSVKFFGVVITVCAMFPDRLDELQVFGILLDSTIVVKAQPSFGHEVVDALRHKQRVEQISKSFTTQP